MLSARACHMSIPAEIVGSAKYGLSVRVAELRNFPLAASQSS